MKTFRTTAAYFSGAICGEIWWPVGQLCGMPVQFDLRGYDGFGAFSDKSGATFWDALEGYLRRRGGDFQNALFSADSEIVIERRRNDGAGKYTVHVKHLPVSDVCPDLVRADTFAGDFFAED